MKVITFDGYHASGKTTYSKMLSDHLGIPRFRDYFHCFKPLHRLVSLTGIVERRKKFIECYLSCFSWACSLSMPPQANSESLIIEGFFRPLWLYPSGKSMFLWLIDEFELDVLSIFLHIPYKESVARSLKRRASSRSAFDLKLKLAEDQQSFGENQDNVTESIWKHEFSELPFPIELIDASRSKNEIFEDVVLCSGNFLQEGR